jgi:hypothetical protein
MMMICWIIGHRYDYDIKKPELMALVCTRCGSMRIICETKVEARTKVKLDMRGMVRPGDEPLA